MCITHSSFYCTIKRENDLFRICASPPLIIASSSLCSMKRVIQFSICASSPNISFVRLKEKNTISQFIHDPLCTFKRENNNFSVEASSPSSFHIFDKKRKIPILNSCITLLLSPPHHFMRLKELCNFSIYALSSPDLFVQLKEKRKVSQFIHHP